jgi:hypothetical protein
MDQYYYTQQELAQIQRQQVQKEKLLASPGDLSKRVSQYVEAFSPALAKPDKKFGSKLEALDAQIPEGHPAKGMGPALMGEMQGALRDPGLTKYSADEILSGTAQNYLMGESKDKPGISRIEDIYRWKRSADAPFLGFGGKTKDVAGYDKWIEGVRKEEEAGPKESYMASPKDIIDQATWGAGISGIGWSCVDCSCWRDWGYSCSY